MRTAFGADFSEAEGFLDTATYGLPPRFVVEALHDGVEQWQRGELVPACFDEAVTAARRGYASLTGVPAESVAMGGSVSALVGLVAAAVPDGARVAVLPGEFTSVTFPFAVQERRGVKLTELAPAELEASAGEFDVVAASLVQSADGRVLDVATLRESAHGSNTCVVLDVTQALGWMAMNLSWADVTVGGSYKWLLAPRGLAWMSLGDRVAERLIPHAACWYAGEDPWTSIYGLPVRLAADARRFDASPAWLPALGAGLSLPWLASLEARAVHDHAVGLAAAVRDALDLPAAESAIVSIPVAGAADRLQQAGIRAAVRAGAVRVAFHLYNTEEDVDRLLDAVRR